jgi:hypothetical protein
MTSRTYSPAVRRAAHQLFQFVSGRMLEQVEVTVTGIEAYVATLEVAEADHFDTYRAAEAEADFRRTDVPAGTDQDYAQDFNVSMMMVNCKISDAADVLMDRVSVRQDQEMARQERQLREDMRRDELAW